MNPHLLPIDVPALLRAVSWPVIAVIGFAIFRRPLGNFATVLAPRVSKLSVGKFSVGMAEVREMKPVAMDADIRQLEAGLIPRSGGTSLTVLVNELLSGGSHEFVVIDLGSDSLPKWLTSRLYLLCFLIMLINRQLCMVFVETLGNVRNRLIGVADPEQVRWALAPT